MKTIQLSTGARKPLKFFLLNLTLFSSVLLAHANSTNQIPARAEDAEPIAVGTGVPDAHLLDLNNKEVTLHALIAGKPTVLIFYRGSWCPYCNAHLSDLVTVEEQLRSLGYQIIAISPDRPEELNRMTTKDHLNYLLFSDPQAEAMKNFGVAYRVDDTTIANYKKFNVDLERSSGQTHHILPVPAVFIINRTGEIVFVHADPDYKVRMKGAEVLAAAAKSAAASEAPQK
jgi:peroxiredoxin